MYVLSQTNPKLFHAGGLKPRDVPSGTSILVSAVRRRCRQIKRLLQFNTAKAFFVFARYRISAYLFKIHSTVLAYRTDKISRKLFSLIDVSAYLAYPALFLFRLSRLGLNIAVIILICH